MTLLTEETLGLVKETLNKANKNSDLDWLEIKDKYNFEHSGEHLRKFGSAFKWLEDNGVINLSNIDIKDYKAPNYRETTEITANGQQKSDKLIEMSEENKKDEKFILQAHGYDESQWTIVNAKHSIYNVNAKGGITKTLYSSKITVKPKDNGGFNVDKFLEKIENIKPKYIQQPVESTERLLTLSFVDLHFGINTCAQYQSKIDETLEIIQSKKWDTIYIPIGNDLLHNNNHNGETANKTLIEKVDMDKATDEALEFYTIMIDESIRNAKNVVADYIPGNHDSDISWMFTKMLLKKYPQVKSNISMDVKKMFKWKNILLINLHGDKGIARVAKTLITEYRDLMVGVKTSEIHSGHLHHEKVKDEYGIVVRTLPTSAETDSWHRDMSFEGSVKTSQLFEYNADKLKVIHHV